MDKQTYDQLDRIEGKLDYLIGALTNYEENIKELEEKEDGIKTSPKI